MPGRTFSAGSEYRYSYNSQEKSDEISGAGNHTTALFWEYDSRIGRRWNVDPKQKDWESPYLCFSGNPILYSDLNGDQAKDPTKVYHRTTAQNAAGVSWFGFDPSKSRRQGFTYFMLDSEKQSIGKDAASGNTLVEATLDISNAKTVTKQQMTGWFNEGLSAANKQLNTKYSSITQVPENLRSTYQSIADGVRNAKLSSFMKNDGGSIYNIEGKNTIAVSDGAISKVNITKFSGEGAGEAMRIMERQSLSGEAEAALRQYGKAANTIKWGGRACIAIAVAADVYEIYQSDNRMRTMNIKVGGWAGALAGASAFAAWGGGAGTVVPGAGNAIGAGAGAIVGGIVGYWAGSTATEIVYDYMFTKGVSVK